MRNREQTEVSGLDCKRSAEKTEAILKGAMQEFLAHGYAATSMDRVAAAAGVSKATVYSHFQDKEGLFAALVQRLAGEKYRAVFGSQDSQVLQGEPRVILRHLATSIVDNAMKDQQLVAFMRVILGESGRFPELAQAYVHNLAKPAIEVLSQYLASRPELQLPDPQATARVFLGTLIYFVILQNMLHGKEILPMEKERLINSLMFHILGSAQG